MTQKESVTLDDGVKVSNYRLNKDEALGFNARNRALLLWVIFCKRRV